MIESLTIVNGFWPDSENFDADKKRCHMKGNLKRNVTAEN